MEYKGKKVFNNQSNLASSVDWRKLFSSSANQSLSYFPHQNSDRKLTISPSIDVFEEGELKWKNSIVARFVGRIPNFNAFQKLVNIP